MYFCINHLRKLLRYGRRLAGWSALALLISSCRHSYDTLPEPEVGVTGFSDGVSGETQPALPSAAWWQFFESSDLAALMAEGLANSFDLRVAEERLRQAEALSRRSRSERYPEALLDLSSGVQIDDDETSSGTITGGIGGGWNLDLNGALRLRSDSRRYLMLAARDERDLARLDLTAAIAEAYLDVIAQDLLMTLLAEQESNARAYLQVVEARFRQGVVGRLDVLQQEGLVAEIRTQIPTVSFERYRSVLRLDTLLGRAPGGELFEKAPEGFPSVSERPSIGEPLALLAERPDLRALRHQLIASDADAAGALAERWPQLALDFDLFWREGRNLSQGILALAARAAQPLFDAGRRKESRLAAEAVVEERRALFSGAFLRAVAEVEELVFAEERANDLIQNLETRHSLLREAESQATERYAQGLTDFLPVITARQELLTIQQRLVRERQNRVLLRIALHRAIGGPMGDS